MNRIARLLRRLCPSVIDGLRVRIIDLGPNDRLVVKVNGRLTMDALKYLTEAWGRALDAPGRVIIVDGHEDIELDVIRCAGTGDA